MTGIKRYALSNRSKPPLTNWVKIGEKYGSFRNRTIVAKAAKASIQVVQKPIAEIGPSDEKYPIRRPLMRLRREGIVPQFPVVHREAKKAAVRKRKIEEEKKVEKKEEEKEHEKKWSIGLVSSKVLNIITRIHNMLATIDNMFSTTVNMLPTIDNMFSTSVNMYAQELTC